MSDDIVQDGNIKIRLATTEAEIEAAQVLRYKVFYDERKAIPTPEMEAMKRDYDQFDSVADHLIVVDESIPDPNHQIVGTYRMLRRNIAEKYGQFYTASEFDINPLLGYHQNLLEMGRSCVATDYRTRHIMQLLWQGIANYVMTHDVQMLFGCASFHGTDPAAYQTELSYLYHYHLAPPELRARALDHLYQNMNIIPKDDLNAKRAFAGLPPLIKGYLRLGAYIGDGAIIDPQFNTVDVCIILPRQMIADRYRKHYERGYDQPLNTTPDDIGE